MRDDVVGKQAGNRLEIPVQLADQWTLKRDLGEIVSLVYGLGEKEVQQHVSCVSRYIVSKVQIPFLMIHFSQAIPGSTRYEFKPNGYRAQNLDAQERLRSDL